MLEKLLQTRSGFGGLLIIVSMLLGSAQAEMDVELNLMPKTAIPAQDDMLADTPAAVPTPLNSRLAQQIYAVLISKYERQDGDPDFILEDFRQIANYYRDFPEVIAMIQALRDKPWRLRYNQQEWVTTAKGNIFEVHYAVIHFNTRAAAQLRLNNGCKNNPVCIASPADALLHELLHTYSMLVKTEEFLAQGGMSSVMYPYKHEYAIIAEERSLYAKMSHRDTIKRPARVDHTGRPVHTRCPTCIN